MSTRFELSSGSVVGRDHRQASRNNQDACAIRQSENVTIAIVADGCSSGKYSEVGAHLCAQLTAENIFYQLSSGQQVDWRRATRQVLARLDVLMAGLGGSCREMVEDYVLCTLVGVAIDAMKATFFACGDGTYVVNGTIVHLGPFPGNMPPYVGYGLLEGRVQIASELLVISPVYQLSVQELDSFLLATDGIDDLIRHERQILPGSDQKVGPISQFWQDDRYYRGNPDLLSRRLRVLARDWPKTNSQPGLLVDDTTIIAGRQKRRLS